MSKVKVSYYLSHPIQYISPLLREMAKEMDLHVYYFSDSSIKGNFDKGFGQKVKWDVPLLDGYNYTFIKNYSRKESISNRFSELINPGVITKLIKDPAKIIIVNGWAYFSVVLTIILAKILGKKVWLRSENPYHIEINKPRKLLFIKKIILGKFLFKLVDKFLYIGQQSKDFYKYYGVKDYALVHTPYCVDNDFFDKQYELLKDGKIDTLTKLNLDTDKKVVLFTGKFIEVKQPLDLVEAFGKMSYKNAQLIMVGDGVLRGKMEELIKEKKIGNVVITGFINQSEISNYYSIADVFVLCSVKETWGLSVNEAMNFCLPVLVADGCGCSSDIVQNDKNGYVFAKGDIDALAGKLDYYLMNDTVATKAGVESKKIIASYAIPHIVNNMLQAANNY